MRPGTLEHIILEDLCHLPTTKETNCRGSLFTCSPPSGAVDSFSCLLWVSSFSLQQRLKSLATSSAISSIRSTTSSGRSTTGSETSSDLDRAQTQNSEQLVIISCFVSWPSFAWMWTIWVGSTCKPKHMQWFCLQGWTSCLIWIDLELVNQTNAVSREGQAVPGRLRTPRRRKRETLLWRPGALSTKWAFYHLSVNTFLKWAN